MDNEKNNKVNNKKDHIEDACSDFIDDLDNSIYYPDFLYLLLNVQNKYI